MKYFLLAVCGLTALTFTLPAQQPAKWIRLFDGKTLKGWEARGGKATYKVERGEIVGTTVYPSYNTFLCTQKTYGDFILELEFLDEGGFNSGIQFRSHADSSYRSGVVYGWQMEIDPSPRAWSGGVYDEQRRGWLYIPDINPPAKTAFRPNDWNRYRIEAIGPVIRTWVNGVPVSCLIDTLVERGFIALQVHSVGSAAEAGKRIRFRNIRLQEGPGLRAQEADNCPVLNLGPGLSEQEKRQGWRLLFNGENFDGWRSAFKSDPPASGWVIDKGVLTIQGSNGSESRTYGDLVTKDSFGAFELFFEFKLTEGANSGVKYFVDEKYDSKGGSAIGLEYQLLDNEHHPDAKQGVVGNRTLASLYDLIPADRSEPRTNRPLGDWQYGRIVVKPDNTVQHWLNGIKVVEYTRGNNIYKALVARSKYADWPGFGMRTKGPILLQDHGNTVSFRNIKIRTF